MVDKKCLPGSKKFAKRVRACNGEIKCIKFGDKSMSIKKHIPSRKKAFCSRFKCSQKTEKATPGYQSCKKWDCKTGSCKKNKKSGKKRASKKQSSKEQLSSTKKIRNPKTGRMVLRTGTLGKSILKKKRTKTSSKIYTSRSGRKYSRCWSGYTQKGWKLKNGRRVPNCVKN